MIIVGILLFVISVSDGNGN